MKSSILLLFCLLLFVVCVSAQETKTVTTRSSTNQPAKSVKYPEIREELLKRLKAAQEIRAELVKKYNGAIPSTEVVAISKIDNENRVWIKSTIEKYGWLDNSLVGEDGENAAFKLVSLAVQDEDFQKKCLELLQKAVKDGEAPAEQPGLLADRIRDAGGQLSTVPKTNNVFPNQINQTVKNPELRDEILQRLKSDQAIRMEVVKNYPPGKPLPDEVIERFKAIDKENTARMKEIVKQYGYPGYSLVGENAAQAAFIMIQHADQDLEFQKQCLELLRKAVEQKDIFPASVAYLTDRIRVAEKKPQLYGTQVNITPDGKVEAPVIEDEANVDKRRAEVGLEPLAGYIERMQQRYKKPGN